MSEHPISKKLSETTATLLGDLTGLSVEQIAALARFVQQAGGIERARQAIESLDKIRKAA